MKALGRAMGAALRKFYPTPTACLSPRCTWGTGPGLPVLRLGLAGQDSLRKRTRRGPERGYFPEDGKEESRGLSSKWRFFKHRKEDGPGVTCEEAETRAGML